ncbi:MULTISPECIES: glycoside hydrolase family 26 protein [unclassified Blastococcus]
MRRALLWTALGVLALLPVLVPAGRGPAGPVTLGVAADDVTALDTFSDVAGAPVGVYQWYQAWAGRPPLDTARADAVAARGALPLLTWEAWSPGGGVDQPDYSLASIVGGAHDDYVRTFARQVRDWGGRLGLRFLHEVNAPHYPWSVGVNGNEPAEAVAAWQHVRRLFEEEGADDVLWVWSVNVHAPGTAPYGPLFPGDDAVDWVAVDGYNGGDALPWGGWRDPGEVFGSSLADLRRLSDRPLAITETGSAEEGGDKAAWIEALFQLVVDEGVRVVVWFQYDKEADWRVDSSSPAASAFRRAVTAPGRVTASWPVGRS